MQASRSIQPHFMKARFDSSFRNRTQKSAKKDSARQCVYHMNQARDFLRQLQNHAGDEPA
jgi:hypothetical protein